MKHILLFIILTYSLQIKAQLSIDQTNTNYSINFDHTIDGVNKGISNAHAYTIDKNVALGFQPENTDKTSREILLAIYNNTNTVIGKVQISFDYLFTNKQNRSSSLLLEYSTDNETFTTIESTTKESTSSLSDSTLWESQKVNAAIEVNISTNDYLYVKWTTDDINGNGSCDELAIDNIHILATEDTSTEISTQKPDNIQIYPNPFYNFITLKAQNNISSIQIYNSIGQNVKSISADLLNSKTINTSDLTSGIYIIKIKLQSGKTFIRKINKH